MTLPQNRQTRGRFGMTLIELLVVVTIAIVLVGSAVPLLRPALRQGAIREASRQLNVYLTGAKTRALQLGRPVGVSIERTQDGSNIAFDVFMVETPPPYAGDLTTAVASVSRATVAGNMEYEVTFTPANSSASLTAASSVALAQPGDTFLIKFGYRGPYYPCLRVGNSFVLRLPAPNNGPPEGWWHPGSDGRWGQAGTDDDSANGTDDYGEAGWPGSDDARVAVPSSAPFQVLLPPKRSAVKPLQLTNGSCIDLEYSGIGVSGREFDANVSGANATNPIQIGFSPSGDVDYVSVGGTIAYPTGTIHLLLASSDKVGAEAPTTTFSFTESISDMSAVWVSVSPRTGLVSSAENGWPASLPATLNEAMLDAREFATSRQSMGGQ